MEIGAVKQAFNNEVILMKKNLNQAKIQIIHKLTRKAKTLAEKKAPEKLKEKLKNKAESAVKEVLIIKKLKPKDIAKFIVTHDGELKAYLNTPEVNLDKACARLLLHKSLQVKYRSIRDRFGNSSIEDLLMSRIERRKMKKEAREKQKNKKKGKEANKAVNAEGSWDVEEIDSHKKDEIQDDDNDDDGEKKSLSNESAQSADAVDNSALVNDKLDDNSESELEEIVVKEESGNSRCDEIMTNDKNKRKSCGKVSPNMVTVKNSPISDRINESVSAELTKDLNKKGKERGNSEPEGDDIVVKKGNGKSKCDDIIINDINNGSRITNKKTPTLRDKSKESILAELTKDLNKKKREVTKNKNFKEKILKRTFNKVIDEQPAQEVKVVDPFFITPTGESYLSVVEPRQPDEVKDIHKQGNRKYRRAVMFGHVPQPKHKRDFKPGNRKFNDLSNSNNKFNNSNDSRKETNQYRNKNLNEKQENEKVEKLHPSWEAKKRKSGILPFQGKKIVFDDDE